MKNMSAWAIRHPTFPIVLFMVLTFVGLVSFQRLPINLNPDVSFPLVSVQVSQPGAAPSEIETQITQKIEGAVRSVSVCAASARGRLRVLHRRRWSSRSVRRSIARSTISVMP